MHSVCMLRILTKADLQIFKERIRDLRDLAWCPFLLPAILLQMRMHELPALLSRLCHFLYRVEKTIGTHKNYRQRLGLTNWKGRSEREAWEDPDFQLAPAELTSIASDCLYYESACRCRQRLLDWIAKKHNGVAQTSIAMNGSEVSHLLNTKFDFMRSSLEEIENRMNYLGKRAEVQMQMVSRPEILPTSTPLTALAVQRPARSA